MSWLAVCLAVLAVVLGRLFPGLWLWLLRDRGSQRGRGGAVGMAVGRWFVRAPAMFRHYRI